jgi:uncharacterized Zn-binding protein involved in type VI secretion
VNGKLVVVRGNQIAPHAGRLCIPDTTKLTKVSEKVFIGGSGIGRIGDSYEGQNTITKGSTNVFSG